MTVSEGQTAIPVPDEQPVSGPCSWCGEPSVGSVEIEKARYRNDRGVKVIARRAIVVPACPAHLDILARQPPIWQLLNGLKNVVCEVRAETGDEAREMFRSMGLTGSWVSRKKT